MEQKVGDTHMLAAGTNRRNYQMDNLKCLLIFSVVFGHMLELFMGKNSPERVIYLVIYSFHMPLFAFVSGVFARYNPSKIKNNMIYPYLIFQTLYLLFSNQMPCFSLPLFFGLSFGGGSSAQVAATNAATASLSSTSSIR